MYTLSNLRKSISDWWNSNSKKISKALDEAKKNVGTGFDPDTIKSIGDTTSNLQVFATKVYSSPVGGIPIPGPYCGPQDIKSIAWMFPDGYIYGTTMVSFVDACKNHNICVSKGDIASADCAREFLEGMQKECTTKLVGLAYDDCIKITRAYFATVSSFDDLAFEAKKELINSINFNLPIPCTGTIYEKICSSSALPDKHLDVGEHLYSRNGNYFAVMKKDGNVVIYTSADRYVKWETGTSGKGIPSHFLTVQDDGNLVIYDGNEEVTWSTGKPILESSGQYCIHMQDDGDLVVYDELNNGILWSSGVNQQDEL